MNVVRPRIVDMFTLSMLLEKSPVPPPPPAMDLRIVDVRFSLENWKEKEDECGNDRLFG